MLKAARTKPTVTASLARGILAETPWAAQLRFPKASGYDFPSLHGCPLSNMCIAVACSAVISHPFCWELAVTQMASLRKTNSQPSRSLPGVTMPPKSGTYASLTLLLAQGGWGKQWQEA